MLKLVGALLVLWIVWAIAHHSRADTDPELVKHFYDPEPAADYLAFLRRKKAA